jgi:hypothetical protein
LSDFPQNSKPPAPEALPCEEITSKGIRCRRPVNPGERLCWQHAHGLKKKWRALTQNQSILFVLTLVGVVGVPVTLAAWLYPNLWEKTTPPVPAIHPPTVGEIGKVPPSAKKPGREPSSGVATRKPQITWTQQPLKPGVSGYPAGESNKPGVLAIVTMTNTFVKPAFEAKCNVPCSFLTAMAIDSSTGIEPLPPQPQADMIRIKFAIPGRLNAGRQVTLDIRSQDERPVSLLWVRPYVP